MMAGTSKIQGFSEKNREEKIRIASEFAAHPVEFAKEMIANMMPRKVSEAEPAFTENAVSEFRLPYSLAPNFLINGKEYIIPMVTEEASVVAAASSAAKFWYDHGGFTAVVSGMTKPGHIHFLWHDSGDNLKKFFNETRQGLMDSVYRTVSAMKSRGGGIESVRLIDCTSKIHGYYQIEVLFNTVNAMGANFINTCLEIMAEQMICRAEQEGLSHQLEIIMAILSNYTPDCLVRCEVSCKTGDLTYKGNPFSGMEFAQRFSIAVEMASTDISRAVTHNKGIFNGIDAVAIATGNDFRAIEAAGHSWACKNNKYTSLSKAEVSNDNFRLSLEVPLAVGVTGGITNLHPMARASLELLGNPDAGTLMTVIAAAGLANHFSAIRALITGGIQKGHMKLHLNNILNQLNADLSEKDSAAGYFSDRKVTYNEVKSFLHRLRSR